MLEKSQNMHNHWFRPSRKPEPSAVEVCCEKSGLWNCCFVHSHPVSLISSQVGGDTLPGQGRRHDAA